MYRGRQQIYNSSNLFHALINKNNDLHFDIESLKNNFNRVSNIVGLTISKPCATQNLKQNHPASFRNFKIRSVRAKSTNPTENQNKSSRKISLNMQSVQHNEVMTKICEKIISIQVGQYKEYKWGFMIDTQLFLQPKKYWKHQNASRIKSQTANFLKHLKSLFNEEVSIILRAHTQQEARLIQEYLSYNNEILFNTIFYFYKNQRQSTKFINMMQLHNVPQNLIIIEQRNEKELILPIFKDQTQLLYLLIDGLLTCDLKWPIEFVNIKTREVQCRGIQLQSIDFQNTHVPHHINLSHTGKNRKTLRKLRSSREIRKTIDLGLRMQQFKEKMIKYIKILQQQKKAGTNSNCSSKTPNQIVAQLVRLNNQNAKQIDNFHQSMMQAGTIQDSVGMEYEIPIYKLK